MASTIQYLGAIPAFLIAIFNWIYVIFALNRFRGVCGFTRAEWLAFLLYLIGGYAAWIAEMCILEDALTALQITASLYRTFVNWFGFILIVNERLTLTRQQLGSLFLVIIIAALWEVQHLMMLNVGNEDTLECAAPKHSARNIQQ